MKMMFVLSFTDTPGTMVKSTGHIVNCIDLNSTLSIVRLRNFPKLPEMVK